MVKPKGVLEGRSPSKQIIPPSLDKGRGSGDRLLNNLVNVNMPFPPSETHHHRYCYPNSI